MQVIHIFVKFLVVFTYYLLLLSRTTKTNLRRFFIRSYQQPRYGGFGHHFALDNRVKSGKRSEAKIPARAQNHSFRFVSTLTESLSDLNDRKLKQEKPLSEGEHQHF
jgi:hypothetical protein